MLNHTCRKQKTNKPKIIQSRNIGIKVVFFMSRMHVKIANLTFVREHFISDVPFESLKQVLREPLLGVKLPYDPFRYVGLSVGALVHNCNIRE